MASKAVSAFFTVILSGLQTLTVKPLQPTKDKFLVYINLPHTNNL